ELNVIRRDLALVDPLLEERVDLIAYERACAVTRVGRNQKDVGRAARGHVVRLPFGWKAFLRELFSNSDRRFELASIGHVRITGRSRDGGNLIVGISAVTGQRKIEA